MTKRPGRTALVHFLSQAVVSIAGFAATFAIAYLLGAEGLGRYSIAVALGFFWLSIPLNAVGMAIKKRMSEGTDPAGFLSAGITINGVLAILLALLVLGAGRVLEGVTAGGEFVRVITSLDVEIAALLVCSAAYVTAIQALHGQQRVGTAGVMNAVERLGRSGIQVFLLLVGSGVAAITFGFAGSLAATAVLVFVLAGVRPVRPGVEHVRELLSYARYAWMSTLRGRVFGWLDTIVLSFFVGASLIGIYEAAWGIASLLAVASGSISQTLFPEVSELSTRENYDRIKHFLDEALAFSGIFIIPGLFGAAALGDRVLTFYRPEFGRGTGVLLVLVAAYIADVYASQLLNVLNAIDRPDRAFRVNTLFIGLNAVLNVALIWTIGWYGAALATALSSSLRAVAGYRAVTDIVGAISVPGRTIGMEVAAAAVMGALVYPVVPLVPHTRLGTVVLVSFGAVVYAVCLLGLSTRVRGKARSLAPVSP